MLRFPEGDEDLLTGVIDLHVHTMPSVYNRPFDVLELSKQAKAVGYKAILFKNHHAINADCMQLTRKMVPGIEAHGGVVLNYPVGGLNSDAVDAAIGFGAKEIWMPTMSAANHIQVFGAPTYIWHKRVNESTRKPRETDGITVFSGDKLVPELDEIFELIADADIILGTSHLAVEEVFAVIKGARRAGVKKILVTHPGWEATNFSIEDQVKMAEEGAILEHCMNSLMPFRHSSAPQHMVEAIQQVGANHCVMATDFGQWRNPHPIEGMRHFIHLMLQLGIQESEIDTMTKENPAKLLGLV
jgi:hypothetical protein